MHNGLMVAAFAAFGWLMSGVAVADEMPDFLKHKYAERPEACIPGQYSEQNGLVVADGAVSGTEFGCTFLTYTPVMWHKDFPVSEYVALASCGDDSGITRPDLISIIHSANTLRLQSQNEYVEMVAKGAWNKPGFISKTYTECPAE